VHRRASNFDRSGFYTEQVGAGSRPSKSTREWANVPPLERVKEMKKWAIKAVFYNEEGEENFTFYEEKTFYTKRGAIRAINSDYGDLLSQDATIDNKNDADLQGFWLDDFDVYKVERGSK
jgi:hypothetical protein